jgi:predicted nucleic acid-binding protein
MLLTDDKAARDEARRRGIQLSGSIGCLVLAVERGHCTLTQANAWLQDMILHDYRSPVSDLTPLLKHI